MLRDLRLPLGPEHFLRSTLAERWVADGCMVPFEWHGERQIAARRLPFVSQPSEWCDAQFFAAARLTLDLQQQAVEEGYDLKDASAWNVLFDGSRPVFCDLFSFNALAGREWWAFGQYVRHFMLPLAASMQRGLRARECFAIWRDGMPTENARRILGWRGLLSRYGALLLGRSGDAHSCVAVREARRLPLSEVQAFRQRLHATMEWQLSGLVPRAVRASAPTKSASAGWSEYKEDRPHYGGDSLAIKRRLICEWLTRYALTWVLDLGCNTGEFSQLALATGAHVIALDADHDCIQQLFLANRGNARLHPLVVQLDDLRGARGWAALEHSGLDQRLEACADVVLMLALIHHLAVGAAVPLEDVARFAHRCTRRLLVVELLEATDPQLMALCQQRQRSPEEFTLVRQREAFLAAGFRVVEEHRLDGASRSLMLLSR